MPGMNSGVDVNDPVVVAAFKSALLHQGIIALLIFGLLGLAWLTVRASWPAAAQSGEQAGPGSDQTALPPAEYPRAQGDTRSPSRVVLTCRSCGWRGTRMRSPATRR